MPRQAEFDKSSVLIGPGRNARRVLQDPGRCCLSPTCRCPSTRLGHADLQSRGRGPPPRQWAGRALFRPARGWTADQFRGDVLRSSPAGEVQLGAQLLAYQSSTSYVSRRLGAARSWPAWLPCMRPRWDTPAVHATQSGVSAGFDARGREIAWYPSDSRGAIVTNVPLGSYTTVYQRLGDRCVCAAVVCPCLRRCAVRAAGAVGSRLPRPPP